MSFRLTPLAADASIGSIVRYDHDTRQVFGTGSYTVTHFSTTDGDLARSVIIELPSRVRSFGDWYNTPLNVNVEFAIGMFKTIAQEYPYAADVQEIHIRVNPLEWDKESLIQLRGSAHEHFPKMKAIDIKARAS